MAQSLFENREQQQPMLRPHLVSLDGEPAFPTTPVLSLELGNISKMSKGGREGLSYMWTVFSRCKESIRDGRRLENLSWRLWYEDLKLTGCVATAPPSLSDPESEPESNDEDDDDDNTFDDAAQDESADKKMENLEASSSSSSCLSDGQSARRRPCSPLTDETIEPILSRGRTSSGKKPEGKNEGPASNPVVVEGAAANPSASSAASSSPTRQSSSGTFANPASSSSPSTSKTVLPPSSSSSSSNTKAVSPSKHIRRSSCPASRESGILRMSRMSNGSPEQEQQGQEQQTIAKKEKRALSFANAHRPPPHGHQRLARAMPRLTPETIQDIIGTVLPMNFKSSPRIHLSSPNPTAITPTSPATSVTHHATPSPAPHIAPQPPSAPTSTALNGRKSPSPTRQAKVEHNREPSFKSERSYFTSTTASSSDLAVDPVFSPSLAHNTRDEHTLPELTAPENTTSAPLPYPSTASSSNDTTSPRLTQSEDTPALRTASPDEMKEEDTAVAPFMQRNPSAHKHVVKPALLTRGKASSASSSRLNRSAIQRTQSAKSVRIIESPTEADGAAIEGTSGETIPPAGPSLHTSQQHQQHQHAPHSKQAKHVHPHVAPKRTLSSTKLRGHARTGSSASLHRDGRMKSPPPITKTPSPDAPAPPAAAAAAAVPTLQPSAAGTAAAPTTERHEMQAAPHVTKAINIRRNNSSLANIIQTEPRSVSRGFAVPGSSGDAERNEEQDAASSPSTPAAAAAAVQSVPDNAPALHPPPPSPASPVIMVPSSVILPPQPRSSPADPRFRVHSTIRRPPSPPLLEEEIDSDRPLSPSRSDHAMSTRVQNSASQARMKTPKRSETAPLTRENDTSSAPRDMKPEPQQLTNAKKKQMFFFSSPTTDSDDEGGHTGSFKFRLASPLPDQQQQQRGSPAHAKANFNAVGDGDAKERRTEHGRDTEKYPGKPAIKVVQVTTPTEEKAQEKNGNDAGQHSDEEDDDDEYEDDSDEWSSEASESEEDEHKAAIRREEERQRLMFAKRTPSMVATQGGLLSKLLRPEEYSHGSANMPVHLRNNASAMHLNQLPNVGSTAGIERARASNALFTVTGLLASKSTAALPDLRATETSKLVPSKSGNHLTRLGGAPSGVELESDDDDDDEAAQDLSPTQQKKLTALMQRTASSNGKPRNTSPPRQDAPQAQVTRVTSAAQIAMQPEPTNVFTPRTTRRNMLATELTESLRASLLAERSKSRPGAAAAGGLGKLVNAVGSRLGVRHQPDSAPSQIQAPVPPPPRIQRGSTGFTPANQDGSAVDRLRPGGRTSAARPPSNPRANSDPPQQTEYYSPGFHHTGW